MQEGKEEMRHWEWGGEKGWCGSPGHNLSPAWSRLLFPGWITQKKNKSRLYLFMWFYIRNIPSVLRSWSSLVCILLRVELVGLFRLKFKGEALCPELRKLHPVASNMVCPHPPPVFPSCFGKARGAGRICMQFPTQRAVLAYPGDHIFPECCFLLSLNNQGGVKS